MNRFLLPAPRFTPPPVATHPHFFGFEIPPTPLFFFDINWFFLLSGLLSYGIRRRPVAGIALTAPSPPFRAAQQEGNPLFCIPFFLSNTPPTPLIVRPFRALIHEVISPFTSSSFWLTGSLPPLNPCFRLCVFE